MTVERPKKPEPGNVVIHRERLAYLRDDAQEVLRETIHIVSEDEVQVALERLRLIVDLENVKTEH